jgi:hypothetical protein
MSEHWSKKQLRGGTKPYRFSPKWDSSTMTFIISELEKMTNFVDIQYQLVKQYGICIDTASNWIEIARRVMIDIKNGFSMDKAIARDKERRNLFRRKLKSKN